MAESENIAHLAIAVAYQAHPSFSGFRTSQWPEGIAVRKMLSLTLGMAALLAAPEVPLAQEPQTCLHGSSSSSANKARRDQAIRLAHEIINAQARVRGEAYFFSIKDTLDPCKYAVFSDQSGDVYEGAALTSVPAPGLRFLSRK